MTVPKTVGAFLKGSDSMNVCCQGVEHQLVTCLTWAAMQTKLRMDLHWCWHALTGHHANATPKCSTGAGKSPVSSTRLEPPCAKSADCCIWRVRFQLCLALTPVALVAQSDSGLPSHQCTSRPASDARKWHAVIWSSA